MLQAGPSLSGLMNADLQQISQQKADATVRGPLPAAAEEREKAPLVGHKQRHRPAEGVVSDGAIGKVTKTSLVEHRYSLSICESYLTAACRLVSWTR